MGTLDDGSRQTIIYTSSLPKDYLVQKECKIRGTTIFNLTQIKYNPKKEAISVTTYSQIYYGMTNFDKFTKVVLPAQADKMYRNLTTYMNEIMTNDVHSLGL